MLSGLKEKKKNNIAKYFLKREENIG